MPAPTSSTPLLLDASGLFQQGLGAQSRGDLAQAERCYRMALALDRRHGPSLHMLGVLAAQVGRYEEAVELLRQAARQMPQDFAVHNNLGNAQHKLGRYADALRSLQRALDRAPQAHQAQVHNNLGNALQGLGRHAEAIQHYQRALELAPEHAECMANLAKALLMTHRAEEALQWAERAVALAPDRPAPHVAKGWALMNLGRPSEGALAVGQWLVRDDRHAEAQYVRGLCAASLERMDLAYPALERAYALEPNWPALIEALADVAARAGHAERATQLAAELRARAEAGQTQAWTVALQVQQMVLDWTDYEHVRQRARAQVEAGQRGGLMPFTALRVWDDGVLQRRLAELYARDAGVAQDLGRSHTWPAADPGRRIRVAYLSADFRNHPTSWLACPMWEAHDRQRFEWIGVYFGPVLEPGRDPWHDRARAAFDRFEVISGLTDEQALARLRALEIDVAVDLMGYTKYARPGLLAARVAPIQVAYLGYPGTTGMAAIDYLVADRWVAPQEAWHEFTEKIIWLPTTYQSNHSQHEVGRRQSRGEVGLPDGVVMGCFCTIDKVSPEVFRVWMEVMRQNSKIILWLLSSSQVVQDRLMRQAEGYGVDPQRIIFAPFVEREQHLARLPLADFFVDTWPYNGHTTVSDYLWMGVPVITREGHSFAGRVAKSLLYAIQAPELVANNEEEYSKLILDFANSQDYRLGIRDSLLEKRKTGSLFDAELRARELEQAFFLIHQNRLLGNETKHFDLRDHFDFDLHGSK